MLLDAESLLTKRLWKQGVVGRLKVKIKAKIDAKKGVRRANAVQPSITGGEMRRKKPKELPRTREAKFLRALDISPNAEQGRLKLAAYEYNREFGTVYSGREMPNLIAKA
jgi:hypothetical protein